jgi:hypothetical protein
MDLLSLREFLASEGFRRDAYDLEDDGPEPSETYVLRIRDGGWVTFYAERGRENERRFFPTFTTAAEDLIVRLKSDPSTRERQQSQLATPG